MGSNRRSRDRIGGGAGPRIATATASSDRPHPALELQRSAGNRALVLELQRLDAGAKGTDDDSTSTPRLTRFRDEVVVGIRKALRVAPADGPWDAAAGAALRRLQSDMQVPETGFVDEATLPHLVTELSIRDDPTVRRACVLLLVDWYGMPVPPNVAIRYDAGVTANAWIDPPLTIAERAQAKTSPPTTISFGPSAFDQSLAGLTHTVRHELKHAEQRAAGIPRAAAGDGAQLGHREELEGELTEILGSALGEESPARFAEDATEAIEHWEHLDAANRKDFGRDFAAARKVVERRLAGDPTYTALLARWHRG